MRKWLMNHKKILVGIGYALQIVALIVLVVILMLDNSEENSTFSNNRTSQAINPDGTTNRTDGTTPSGNTDPTGPDASDPTKPSSGVTEPTTEPTVGTYPTNPETGEDVIPTAPTQPEGFVPSVDDKVDLGGVTPGTLTADIWNSWTKEQKYVFERSYIWEDLSLDDKFNLMNARQCNGYEDGYEDFYFFSEEDKLKYFETMKLGCRYCGETDCECFYGRGRNGETTIDYTRCPAYSETMDPTKYCQECGLPKNGESGTKICIRTVSGDIECPFCKEMIYFGKCHEGTKP